jgi:hypothetical protein
MLLLQYTWASFVSTVEENDSSHAGFGTLSALYGGLRQLGLHLLVVVDPYFTPIMNYRPILRIAQYFENLYSAVGRRSVIYTLLPMSELVQ